MEIKKEINSLETHKDTFQISPLAFQSEFLLTQILYATKITQSTENKMFAEKISQLLTTFIWIGQKKFLPQSQERELAQKLQELSEDLHLDQLEGELLVLLRKIIDRNAKCRIAAILTDLEHLSCIHPPVLKADSEKIFALTEKILSKLGEEWNSFEMKAMERKILEARAHFLKDPNDLSFLYDTLHSILPEE
ncbi:MAG: hypothetical protein JW769_03245 [Parachlamydiales bacterium]|nr:hypothetical protein [Parachlamydiales bacterium]